MPKNTVPVWAKILLFFGVVLCSLLSGTYMIPAIAFYVVLCLAAPSPLLLLAPALSFGLTFAIFAVSADVQTALINAASAISYLFPALLIAMAYLKKQSKLLAVFNGTIGLFLYTVFVVVFYFILNFGAFTPELLNSSIDALINDSMQMFKEFQNTVSQNALNTLPSDFQNSQPQTFDTSLITEVLYTLKPLIPAYLVSVAFIFSYSSVCISNAILKRAKIIEDIKYHIIPHWSLGIVFFIALIANWFTPADSFIAVVFASIIVALMPLFVIVGIGTTAETLFKMFKNRVVPIILLVVTGLIIYNLFYLIGCYYSIITGIRNIKNDNSGGEKQ